LSRVRSTPIAKLRLAALRHPFDWMVIGQIMPTNPAAAVRGPRHIVRRGKTPVLDPAEARQLIDAIDTTTVIGLRDRALIGLIVYSFARIGAAIGMRVEDVYTQNRRLWVRAREGRQAARQAVSPQSRILFARTLTARDSRATRRRCCFRATVARPASSPAIPCPRPMPTR
jgi:site-specific recombinase XerC